MEETTLFSFITGEMWQAFSKKGFHYIDTTYINVFRWLWNERCIHPRIDIFPTDKNNRCMISIYNPITKNTDKTFGNSYDDAIIKSVEYIFDNIDILPDENEES